MFTVCPKCALTLVVTAADLRVAQGYVRCGRCSNVFNAIVGLSEDRSGGSGGPTASTSIIRKAPSVGDDPPHEGIADTGENESVYAEPARNPQEVTSQEVFVEAPQPAPAAKTPPKSAAPPAAPSRPAPKAPPPEPAFTDSIPDIALEFNPEADLAQVFIEAPPMKLDLRQITGTFQQLQQPPPSPPAPPPRQAPRQQAAPPPAPPQRARNERDGDEVERRAVDARLDANGAQQAGRSDPSKQAALRADANGKQPVPRSDASGKQPALRTDANGRAAAPKSDANGRQATAKSDANGRQAAPKSNANGRQAAPPPDTNGRSPAPRSNTVSNGAAPGADAASRSGTRRALTAAASSVPTPISVTAAAPKRATADDVLVFRGSQYNSAEDPATLARKAAATAAKRRLAQAAPPPAAAEEEPVYYNDDDEFDAPPPDNAAAYEIAAELAPRPLRRGRRLAWISGIAALGVVLAAQAIHHNRHDLATNASLNRPLTRFYAAIGVPLVPRWNPASYEVRQLGAFSAAGDNGNLTVRASLKNDADQPLPLPLLRITVQDRYGNRIATRDVEPKGYVPGALPDNAKLGVGQRIDAEMSFKDPGRDAVGFEIDACLPTPEGRIACANDTLAAR
jgi:predicted Zn finger-like uncharacterized protein